MTKQKMATIDQDLQLVGWREWVRFPDFSNIPVKAKVDTGAKTSSLHAFYIEPFTEKEQSLVRFLLHPKQKDTDHQIECVAPVKDRREVMDSGGHRELRYVIEVPIQIGSKLLLTELTLTDRDTMLFRMLIGRNALNGNFLVNSSASFLLGGKSRKPPAEV